MDEADVREACTSFSWRSWRDSLADLSSLAASDPTRFWSVLNALIGDTTRPEEAEEFAPGLLALFSLDAGWEDEIARAARDSHKVATALSHSVDVLAPRLVYDLLGREFVVKSWMENNRAWAARSDDETPWEFWAWEVVEGSTTWDTPEEQWSLVHDLIAASDSEDSLGAVAAGPLEDFIHHDWRAALTTIEREAPTNERLRRALAGVNLPLDLPDDAETRFRALAAQRH